jgi:hypothetical protein
MERERRGRRQSGYLMEIPLLVAAVGVSLMIVLPMVSAIAGKALVIVAALIGIGGLYYMFVVPGWLPGQEPYSRSLWGKVAFVAAAVAIVAAAVRYVWVD